MQTRPLTNDGPHVSEIGFGAWAIGGQWGDQDDQESKASLHAAIDRGINLIDTAQGYGEGHSERLIADVLGARSEEIFVATKTPPDSGPWPPSPYCRWQDRYSAAYLRENVHQRLNNLNRERIDLLQLHTWTAAWNDDPQPLLVLRQLKEEGKIGMIGVSTPEHDQSCVIQLMRNGLIDTIQVIFNLFQQEAAAQIFQVAEETGTGVLVRVALDEGSLTGKYGPDHLFSEDDFRHLYFQGDRQARTAKRVEAVKHDLEQFGIADQYSMADIALKYALARPEVSSVIVGMRNVDQVTKNSRVSELRNLTPEIQQHLRRHNWRRGIWYSGK
ncbi:aldo/keto reductase [Rhodopirellula sp.]|nr:aldo/keto reductase [Rhodopirellula sp.]MDB4678762.1 aldo/keto reductase [Rhodopirellula sp.]MDB4809840.1 aldo/keto reductase [bacterium]